MLEILGQRVDQRHHLVAAGHGQRAARTEIVLHVDDDQRLFHAVLHCHARERSPENWRSGVNRCDAERLRLKTALGQFSRRLISFAYE